MGWIQTLKTSWKTALSIRRAGKKRKKTSNSLTDTDVTEQEESPWEERGGLSLEEEELAINHIQNCKKRTHLPTLGITLFGCAVFSIYSIDFTIGFFCGILLGLLNQRMAIKMISRSFTMHPLAAKNFITNRFFMRFILTVMILTALIGFGGISPLALIVGFTTMLLITILTLAVSVVKEYA